MKTITGFFFFQPRVTGTSGPPDELTQDSAFPLKELSAVQDVIQFMDKLLGQIGPMVYFTTVFKQHNTGDQTAERGFVQGLPMSCIRYHH